MKSEPDSIDALVGMLTRTLSNQKNALTIRLKKFGLALRASPPLISRANQLFFLCGANTLSGVPSARRDALKKFIETQSSEYKVIYAEKVFSELIKIGNTHNVLDLEHEVSGIADRIIIILESQSAFCELGAFAHPELRKKLIVINDSQYRETKSFINVGPIAAVEEAKSSVLWYPMSSDGIDKLDAIGKTFAQIKQVADASSSAGSVRINGDISTLTPTKASLYFVHDLVLFTGPLSHKELISILIVAFGQKNYDLLKSLLGVLRAADLIRSSYVDGTWVYQCVHVDSFLTYLTNTDSLMASFRRLHLQENSNRFVDG